MGPFVCLVNCSVMNGNLLLIFFLPQLHQQQMLPHLRCMVTAHLNDMLSWCDTMFAILVQEGNSLCCL